MEIDGVLFLQSFEVLQRSFVGLDLLPDDRYMVDIPIRSISSIIPKYACQELPFKSNLRIVDQEFHWQLGLLRSVHPCRWLSSRLQRS